MARNCFNPIAYFIRWLHALDIHLKKFSYNNLPEINPMMHKCTLHLEDEKLKPKTKDLPLLLTFLCEKPPKM
jgi:hypothetical protein